MQGVLFAHKMKEHYQHGYRGAECGRNARALNSHVEGEYKKVVAENIENTADDDRCGGKSRVGVVAQERREDAGKDVHRYGEERCAQIASAEREEKVVGSEQAEHRKLKKKEKQPQYRRDDTAVYHRGGEITVGAFLFPSAPRATAYSTEPPMPVSRPKL